MYRRNKSFLRVSKSAARIYASDQPEMEPSRRLVQNYLLTSLSLMPVQSCRASRDIIFGKRPVLFAAIIPMARTQQSSPFLFQLHQQFARLPVYRDHQTPDL